MKPRTPLAVLALVAAIAGGGAPTPAAAQAPAQGITITGVCPQFYDPVCARKKDRMLSFSNSCAAGLEGATVLAKGRCPEGCPPVYKPVCAEDTQGVRRNYGNACAAEKDGAKIIRNRRCFFTFGRR